MLCQAFVESQNGSIRTQSEEGKDSVCSTAPLRAAACAIEAEEAAGYVLA